MVDAFCVHQFCQLRVVLLFAEKNDVRGGKHVFARQYLSFAEKQSDRANTVYFPTLAGGVCVDVDARVVSSGVVAVQIALLCH